MAVPMMDIDDFLPVVIRFAPTCPEPILVQALRSAAIDICRAGRAWSDTITQALDGTAATTAINAPPHAAVISIASARFDGTLLKHVTLRWLDERFPSWRAGSAGPSRFLSQDVLDAVTLYPIAAGRLDLNVSLKPSIDAAAVPAFLSTHHRDAMAWGAAATVMLMPGQSYSNPQLGPYYEARFASHLDGLRTRQPMGQTQATRRTTGRYF